MASKVFIVTGGSKGVGAAVVQCLLKQSHKVVIGARSEDLLQSVKKANPGQVEYVAGDMTSKDMPAKLTSTAVQAFGKVDGIVMSHGVLTPQLLSKAPLESIKADYDINVFSCIAMAQAGIEELRKTKGALIWISSGAALFAYKSWGVYGSSKAAMNSLAAHLAAEEPDITSIAIQPGRVDTDMQAAIRATGKEVMDEAQYASFTDAHEKGELLKPEQPGTVIANLVANPPKQLSGKFFSWKAPELEQYRP